MPGKKAKWFEVGAPYAVLFLDHVEDGDEPMEFELWGRCVKQGKTSVTIAPWSYRRKKGTAVDFDVDDTNEKPFTLVRSAIQRHKKLPTPW